MSEQKDQVAEFATRLVDTLKAAPANFIVDVHITTKAAQRKATIRGLIYNLCVLISLFTTYFYYYDYFWIVAIGTLLVENAFKSIQKLMLSITRLNGSQVYV